MDKSNIAIHKFTYCFRFGWHLTVCWSNYKLRIFTESFCGKILLGMENISLILILDQVYHDIAMHWLIYTVSMWIFLVFKWWFYVIKNTPYCLLVGVILSHMVYQHKQMCKLLGNNCSLCWNLIWLIENSIYKETQSKSEDKWKIIAAKNALLCSAAVHLTNGNFDVIS